MTVHPGVRLMATPHRNDLIAIRRALMIGGRDRALTELRRLWPGVKEQVFPDLLDRLLATPVPELVPWRPEKPGRLKR